MRSSSKMPTAFSEPRFTRKTVLRYTEELELVDPRHKSYVAVDDMQHVTNIIEKRVVSHLFNAGGYCFEDVAKFLKVYDKYASLGHVYLSHLIYAMLLDGDLFRPIQVKEYNDWNIQ